MWQPKANIKTHWVLLDAFHIYKGGSAVDSLPFVGKTAIEVFHIMITRQG